jgi:hypothetical protein
MECATVVVRAATRNSIYVIPCVTASGLHAIHFLFASDRIDYRVPLEKFSGHSTFLRQSPTMARGSQQRTVPAKTKAFARNGAMRLDGKAAVRLSGTPLRQLNGNNWGDSRGAARTLSTDGRPTLSATESRLC